MINNPPTIRGLVLSHRVGEGVTVFDRQTRQEFYLIVKDGWSSRCKESDFLYAQIALVQFPDKVSEHTIHQMAPTKIRENFNVALSHIPANVNGQVARVVYNSPRGRYNIHKEYFFPDEITKLLGLNIDLFPEEVARHAGLEKL